MTIRTISDALPEQLKSFYDAIVTEIQPFVDTESYPQAINRINMILQSIPTDQENRLLRAALLAKRGEMHMESESYEDAEEDIRHAIHNGMRVPPVFVLSGWTHYYLEDLDKSRQFFDRALEEDASFVDALMGRAMVLQELDDLDMARADLTHAIRFDERNASLYALRADIHILQENLDQAMNDIRKAREIDGDDVDYALAHARLEAVQGNFTRAASIVNQALQDDEDLSLEALLLRSYLSLLTNKKDEARSDAMTASNRFSDEAFAFVQLAQVQLAQGNTSLALKAAERAVKLDASLPDAYLVRGHARQAKGDETGAQEDFKRASSASPELPLFIFGSAYEAVDQDRFNGAINQLYQKSTTPQKPAQPAADPFGGANPFAGMPGLGGMGGMDPMKMMGQLFDEEGNIRPMFRPFLRMALKNAPSMLKNMPSSMTKNMGVDPEMLKNMDLDNISSEELEAQMKAFYQMMKAGQNPLDPNKK